MGNSMLATAKDLWVYCTWNLPLILVLGSLRMNWVTDAILRSSMESKYCDDCHQHLSHNVNNQFKRKLTTYSAFAPVEDVVTWHHAL